MSRQRLLLVRMDHLGDILLTTPLVRALSIGQFDVDILTRKALSVVFDQNPYVSGSFSIEEVAPNFPHDWMRLAKWMRQRQYDVLALIYARPKELCWASLLSGTKNRIAMWGGVWGRLTLHHCLRSKIEECPRPCSDILLDCARSLNLAPQGLKPDLFLTAQEESSMLATLQQKLGTTKLIGIHPGCAGNTCNLPSAEYGKLASLILEQSDYNLVITGSQEEKHLLSDWPPKVLASSRVWSSMGALTIRELACVIKALRVYVCPSTGPLHLASAVGATTLSPFCPLPPLCATIWGNQGGRGEVIEPLPNPCKAYRSAGNMCDFRGEVTAESLFTKIQGLLT